MKKYAAPLTLALACIAYGLVAVYAFYFSAQAQGATNVCNPDCFMQKMDAINQKTQALEHTVGELTLQIKKSIKTGQTALCGPSISKRALEIIDFSFRSFACLLAGLRDLVS
jgi:hypothetical protein